MRHVRGPVSAMRIARYDAIRAMAGGGSASRRIAARSLTVVLQRRRPCTLPDLSGMPGGGAGFEDIFPASSGGGGGAGRFGATYGSPSLVMFGRRRLRPKRAGRCEAVHLLPTGLNGAP